MKERNINGPITDYNEPFIIQRADPYIYKHKDGTYYFTASVPEYDKIILRHADSLQGLRDAEEVVIWTKHMSGPMSKHIWAPEIHYLYGKWYIYFAAGEEEDFWKIRPYVLECVGADPLTGEWVEKGKMNGVPEDTISFNTFSLDATVFEHKGKNYFVWAERASVGDANSNLYIACMAEPDRLATPQVLLTTPEYEWERVGFLVNEGPAVVKRNGNIYITYSASATGACYCMGMLSTTEDVDLLDPKSWIKEKEPVVKTDSEKGIYGPGHNSFTKDEKGNDICVFHARTYEEIDGEPLCDPNRHTMLMKVEWDKEDRPIFAFNTANKAE